MQKQTPEEELKEKKEIIQESFKHLGYVPSIIFLVFIAFVIYFALTK